MFYLIGVIAFFVVYLILYMINPDITFGLYVFTAVCAAVIGKFFSLLESINENLNDIRRTIDIRMK